MINKFNAKKAYLELKKEIDEILEEIKKRKTSNKSTTIKETAKNNNNSVNDK